MWKDLLLFAGVLAGMGLGLWLGLWVMRRSRKGAGMALASALLFSFGAAYNNPAQESLLDARDEMQRRKGGQSGEPPD